MLQTGARTAKSNTKTQAFSLIELCFVLLIISIIVAVAAPRFRNTYNNIKFRNAVYNVAKLMAYARDRAIIERKPVRIRFFKQDVSFCLEIEKDEKEENISKRRKKEPEFEVIKGSVGQKMYFPEGIDFDIDEPDRQDYVTFFPDGQSEECVIYIKSNDKSGMVYTITTKKMSGLVKVFDEKKRL